MDLGRRVSSLSGNFLISCAIYRTIHTTSLALCESKIFEYLFCWSWTSSFTCISRERERNIFGIFAKIDIFPVCGFFFLSISSSNLIVLPALSRLTRSFARMEAHSLCEQQPHSFKRTELDLSRHLLPSLFVGIDSHTQFSPRSISVWSSWLLTSETFKLFFRTIVTTHCCERETDDHLRKIRCFGMN